MPSNSRSLFTIGKYQVVRRDESPRLYLAFYDPRKQQEKRVSLRTTDINEAQQAAILRFQTDQNKNRLPSSIAVGEILTVYHETVGKNCASASNKRTHIKRLILRFAPYSLSDISDEPEIISDVMDDLQSEYKFSASTRISYEGTLFAALNHSRYTGTNFWSSQRTENPDDAEPKGRELTNDELVALLNSAEPHLNDFIALSIATGGRPTAVLEIEMDRVDPETGAIDLQPKWRKKTKKRRPIVPMPKSLQSKLLDRQGRLIQFRERPIQSIRKTWITTRDKLKLDEEVRPYSIRHTVARHLVYKAGISRTLVGQFLGHRNDDSKTTVTYAPYDPITLGPIREAIDDWLCDLSRQGAEIRLFG